MNKLGKKLGDDNRKLLKNIKKFSNLDKFERKTILL